jgi:DNA ligase-1
MIKPLLAGKVDFDKIRFPVLATPKLDGIRCLMVDGVAMSRTMKPIPNLLIQEQLAGLHGLDGELMVNGDYNAVQSGIMKRDGTPDFTYHVFDRFDLDAGYTDRINSLMHVDKKPCRLLMPIQINDISQLTAYLEECLAAGYEGAMIRDPDGIYKHGRSTVNEGILLKLKKFLDSEAKLIEIVEKMHNGNELEQDALGYAKRSTSKENLIPAGTAGAMVLEWAGVQFRCGFGPGITDAVKLDWWARRDQLQGGIIKFSYQELSKDGVPRFGKVLGFRHEIDCDVSFL